MSEQDGRASRWASWLRSQLNHAGWTGGELISRAQAAGTPFSKSTVSRWLNAQQHPDSEVVFDVAKVLRADPREAFEAIGYRHLMGPVADKIWIVTRTNDEYGFSVLDGDDPITATVEDARVAFIDAVRGALGGKKDYTIALEAIPIEPDHAVTSDGIVLTCRQVSSGLRAASLKARRAELEQELAQINQELERDERDTPWNA